jgi:hypothetical protein
VHQGRQGLALASDPPPPLGAEGTRSALRRHLAAAQPSGSGKAGPPRGGPAFQHAQADLPRQPWSTGPMPAPSGKPAAIAPVT